MLLVQRPYFAYMGPLLLFNYLHCFRYTGYYQIVSLTEGYFLKTRGIRHLPPEDRSIPGTLCFHIISELLVQLLTEPSGSCWNWLWRSVWREGHLVHHHVVPMQVFAMAGSLVEDEPRWGRSS